MPPTRERYKERVGQADEIARWGAISSIPCSYCFSRDRPCLQDARSRGQRCERRLHTDKEWDDLQRNPEKVAFDVEKAQKQYREYSHKMRESLTRLMRVRKQQNALRERADKMIRHDQEVLGLEMTENGDPTFMRDLAILDRLADEHEFSSDSSLNWFHSPTFWATADLLAVDITSPTSTSTTTNLGL